MVLLSDARAVVHLDLDGSRAIFGAHGWRHDARGPDPLFISGLRGALDVFAAADIRATLFVIAQDLDEPAHRALIDEAVAAGHEIASHTATHAHLPALDDARLAQEIAGSRERLMEELRVLVHGFRAPAFSMDARVLPAVAAAGYRYDSSLFAGARSPDGSHRLGSGPCPVLRDDALLELPLPPHRPLPLPWHASYALVLGEWYFRAGLAIARSAELLVVLLHLTDFAEPLRNGIARGPARRLYTLSHRSAAAKQRACARMLERVARTRSITTTTQALALHQAAGAETHA